MSKNTNLSFLTDYITADITNGRIGINNASPAYAFDVTGIARTSTSTYLATASGNVGIGTTSPTNPLQVETTGADLGIQIYRNVSSDGGSVPLFMSHKNTAGAIKTVNIEGLGSGDMLFRTGATGLATFGSERMRITSAGNVGIGTSSPAAKLHIAGGDRGTSIRVDSADNAGVALYNSTAPREYQIYTAGDGSLTFLDNTVVNTRMKLFNNGNFAIATSTDNGYKLYVSGTIYATGNITANSDLTLKKNLKLIDNPIDKLMQLNGYAYQWKANDEYQYGVIAQEVEKILPYAVSTGNDGIKGVSYNQLIAVLVEGIKELKAEITLLKNK